MRGLGHDAAVLTEIVRGLRGRGAESHLASVAGCLTRVLDVPYAFVAEAADAGTARVLASSAPEGRAVPPAWTLEGTVCAEVLERGSAAYRAGAARRFPADPCLGALRIEGFSGVVLRDAADTPIGVVAVMEVAPLAWTAEADALLAMLALTAELEIRRLRSERKLSRVARQWTATVDAIPDLVAVVGPDFRLLRVNLALARYAGCAPRELVGRPCHQVFHGLCRPWRDCPHEQAMRTGRSVTQELSDPHVGRPWCLNCTPFHDDDGRLVGTVHVARDVSEQQRAVRQREELIGELQATLAKVKVLSGLLPICAVCKKIRNDAGYWEQVEVYVRDRTDATFSHGICPECARELYPDCVT